MILQLAGGPTKNTKLKPRTARKNEEEQDQKNTHKTDNNAPRANTDG